MQELTIKTKKKSSLKLKVLGIAAVLGGAVVLSACTQNFCSNTDFARIMRSYEPGVITFYDVTDTDKPDNTQPFDVAFPNLVYATEKNGTILKIDDDSVNQQLFVPTMDFWVTVDTFAFNEGFKEYAEVAITLDPSKTEASLKANMTAKEANDKVMRNFSYRKFLGAANADGVLPLWEYFDQIVSQERLNDLRNGTSNAPTETYLNTYKTNIRAYADKNRSCIAIKDGEYGYYVPFNSSETDGKVAIELKDWGYAWSKGPLEGLIVFPVAYMTETFSFAFSGAGAGWAQVLAIILVTVIVRLILQALTFWATGSQIKMQAVQPELAKIQAKYPNSKENRAEKDALAREQQLLYKKHGVKVWMPFIQMAVQFPIFISVWGAMTGAASLSSDALMAGADGVGLRLSATMSDVLIAFDWTNVWWTAGVIFLIMAITQVGSMLLPQFLTKLRAKRNLDKTGPTPKQTGPMSGNMMSVIMSVVIIVMGLFLPTAMAIYWIIGAIISALTSLVVHFLTIRAMDNLGKPNYRSKKKVKNIKVKR